MKSLVEVAGWRLSPSRRIPFLFLSKVSPRKTATHSGLPLQDGGDQEGRLMGAGGDCKQRTR